MSCQVIIEGPVKITEIKWQSAETTVTGIIQDKISGKTFELTLPFSAFSEEQQTWLRLNAYFYFYEFIRDDKDYFQIAMPNTTDHITRREL